MSRLSLDIKTCLLDIYLPPGAILVVDVGKSVHEEEIIAKIEDFYQDFDLSAILKVAPKKLASCLLFALGSKVQKGDILARKKSFLTEEIFRSPLSGRLESLTIDGILRIKSKESCELKSPVKGRISKEINESVTIEFEALVLEVKFGEGPESWGELILIGERDEEVLLTSLPSVLDDKILVVGGKVSGALINKSEALGAKGILGGFLDRPVNTYDLVTLIAGNEDGLISEDFWDKLKKHQGKKVIISGKEKSLKIPL